MQHPGDVVQGDAQLALGGQVAGLGVGQVLADGQGALGQGQGLPGVAVLQHPGDVVQGDAQVALGGQVAGLGVGQVLHFGQDQPGER